MQPWWADENIFWMALYYIPSWTIYSTKLLNCLSGTIILSKNVKHSMHKLYAIPVNVTSKLFVRGFPNFIYSVDCLWITVLILIVKWNGLVWNVCVFSVKPALRRYIFNWMHFGTGTIVQIIAGKTQCCQIVSDG